jgi:predicted adenine nucleotide alpha hydrolase (AANH) superfamily ATPase
MMKVLLHICCAPCTVYPLKVLRAEGHEVQGYFYNPNIHPYTEFSRRRDTVATFAGIAGLEVTIDEG